MDVKKVASKIVLYVSKTQLILTRIFRLTKDTLNYTVVRFILYVCMLVLGYKLLINSHHSILYILTSTLPSLGHNGTFSSALAIFLFTLPVVSFNWFLKNGDQLKQFRDTQQIYNENLLANAQILFKEDDVFAKSIGLKQLISLRHKNHQDSELVQRIDMITSSGLKLENAQLQKVDFQKAKLMGANLRSADLQQAKLNGASLSSAELEPVTYKSKDSPSKYLRANLNYADLNGTDLQEAKLNHADLYNADLQHATLISAELYDANLQRAELNHTNLLNANLQHAILIGANLQSANLFIADLRCANLCSANFLDTELHKAKLKRAIYNEKTVFPRDFKPEDHDMVRGKYPF